MDPDLIEEEYNEERDCALCHLAYHEPVFMNCAKAHKFCFSCICSIPSPAIGSCRAEVRLSQCPLCKTGDGSIVMLALPPNPDAPANPKLSKLQERFFFDAFVLCYNIIKEDCGWGDLMTVVPPAAIEVYARNATSFKTIVKCTDPDEKLELIQALVVKYPPWVQNKKAAEKQKAPGALRERPQVFSNILSDQYTALSWAGIGLPSQNMPMGENQFKHLKTTDLYDSMASGLDKLQEDYGLDEIERALNSIDRNAKSTLSYEETFCEPLVSTDRRGTLLQTTPIAPLPDTTSGDRTPNP
jgi:hypothetical protein